MKIALVIHRFGQYITGGSERLCHQTALQLKCSGHDITVLTTCARDYISWKNHFKPGQDIFDGLAVLRFPVERERNQKTFNEISTKVFEGRHSRNEEEEWVRECGPFSPQLIRYIRENRDKYDRFIFFAYRYYNSYFGLREVPEKSVLVPTAERDKLINLEIYREFFSLPRGIIYISKEEKELVNSVTGNHCVKNRISALGIPVEDNPDPDSFRQRYGMNHPYILYLGRIDNNKGSGILYEYFIKYKKVIFDEIKLVLCGHLFDKVPEHRDIVNIGFIPEDQKFNALSACEFLVMPSLYESLCIVTLEAWAMKKAVLVNEKCNVLKGQVIRSGGGLYFDSYKDFIYCTRYMLKNRNILKQMGMNGYNYIRQNYSWKKVMEDYQEMLV